MTHTRSRRSRFAVLGLLLFLCLNLLGSSPVGASLERQTDHPVYIYFFWGDGCPHCAEEEPFLEELERRYSNVEVLDYETWYNESNQKLFLAMSEAFGFQPQGVPTTFIGERYWIGYNEEMGQEIEAYVAACVEAGCPDAGVGVIPGHESQPEDVCTLESCPDVAPEEAPKVLRLPWIGEVNLEDQSLWVSTALIGFVDGFNPCSLWVLSILIALTLHTGSRKRIFIVGFVYILITAGIYTLFIAGLFTMLTFISYLTWIQSAVSILALLFALVNIKDYFWYKEGISFTIADEKKPGIYKRMRDVINAGDSLPGLILATSALAAGVSLIEFSCTAGFPVVWTNLVAAQDVAPATFAMLLLLYMLIYQLDELVIFLVAVFTLRASKLEEKHGRILKLIGGTLMLTLSAVMLIDPALMNNLSSSLLIFGVAFLISMAVLVVHRYLLPRFGIYIGTEMAPPSRGKRRRGRRS